MKTNFLSILLMLVATITIIAIPASAGEVTITFDEGRLDAGDEIGSTYSDLGVIFSPGAKIIDTKFGSGEDLGFWNPNNHITTIYFSPAVKSVSIEFEDAIIGNMDALLVNGEKLSTSKWNWLITTNTLRIESKTENIQKIEISDGSQCINLIKFDNLRYNQIPEFPTVAFPIAAVIGMMFIFQRRKN
ncbi:PEF-CTERM sorting domain-containing protein [Methanosarcina sp. DH2]|nr:PEF-CTERM sorting domain-containing protein [Methanosarcina sp. DH2]